MLINIAAPGNPWVILIAIIAYLLGSFPSAYYITKRMIGKDIRSAGSGNIGAMNAYRLIKINKSTKMGAIAFLLALVGDVGKGVLAIFVAKWLSFLGYDLLLALIASSVFVIVGHNYSFFFKGKGGGRGISSLAGVVLALNPLALLLGLVTFLLTILVTEYAMGGRINWGKFSSVFSALGSQILGRVVGLALALIPIYFFGPAVFFPALAADILVLIKHIERIRAYIRQLPSRKQSAIKGVER